MVNVDRAIRILSYACTDEYDSLSRRDKDRLIDELLSTPKEKLPTIYRSMSGDEIAVTVDSLNSRLRKKLTQVQKGKIVSITSDSNSNRVGADIIAKVDISGKVKMESVELKFGNMTDRALGLESFDSIFPVKGRPGFFQDALLTIRAGQLDFVRKHPGDIDGLISNLREQLSSLTDEVNEMLDRRILSIDSKALCEQVGATGSVTNDTAARHPLRFFIEKKTIKYDPNLDLSGRWDFQEIGISKSSKKARFTVKVTNGAVLVRLVLNWKNDLDIDGIKYPSRTGVNRYSFNVWAKPLDEKDKGR